METRLQNDSVTLPCDVIEEAHIALNITKRCNQRCVFCFEGDRATWDEPSREQVYELLRAGAERHNFAIFMGGEALLRPDILEIIRYGTSLGLRMAAFSNGQVLARDGFVAALAEAGLVNLQVSFHYADAESFAEGAGVRASGFERLLRGLRNVRDHNAGGPEGEFLSVVTETELFALNVGRLQEIRALLQDTLGDSFVGMNIGSLVGCSATIEYDGYLLDPLAERREELVAFIETHPADKGLHFPKLPLCLIPGQEHRSVEAINKAFRAQLISNFADKHRAQAMYDYAGYLEQNPYRWVCRCCTLLPLCSTVRTQWDAGSMKPRRDQKPIPFRDVTPEDVLGRVVREEDIPHGPLGELRALQDAVPMPELPLVERLRDFADDELVVEDIYVEGTPILDVAIRCGQSRVRLGVRCPQRDRPDVGLIVGALEVVGAEGGSVPEWALPLVRALASPEVSGLAGWRSYAYLDLESSATTERAWSLLGESVWGQETWAGWSLDGARLRDQDVLELTLSRPTPGGDDATLLVGAAEHVQETLPVADRQGARVGLVPPRTLDAELCGLLDAVAQRAGGGPPEGGWESRLPRRGNGDASTGPGGERRESSGFENRSGTLRFAFRDRQGVFAPQVFHVGAVSQGDRVFRRVRDIGLTHAEGAEPRLLEPFARVFEVAMRAAPAPPDGSNQAAWRSVVERTFSRSKLSGRFLLGVSEDGEGDQREG